MHWDQTMLQQKVKQKYALSVCCVAYAAIFADYAYDLMVHTDALPNDSLSIVKQSLYLCCVAGVPRFCAKWCILQFVSFICLLVTLGAATGSIAQIVLDTEDYTPFVTQY